jgi:uncharacterized protein (DUF4415 family)
MKNSSTAKADKNIVDQDNPEWTPADFRQAVPFSGLPSDLQRVIRGVRHGRGPQKVYKKVPVSIRLSSDVVEGLRATGAGWQVRADEALRLWLNTDQKSAR